MPGPVDSLPAEDLAADVAWLRGFARRLVGDEEELADLTQEAWAAALQKAPAELDRRGLRSWLAHVLRNRAYRGWRERALRRHHEGARGVDTAAGDVAEELVRRQTGQRVSELLAELEEPYRTAVVLRHREGLGYDALARRLGIDAVAARKRVSRGIGRLRERLRRELGEESWREALAVFALGARPAAPARPLVPWIVAAVAAALAGGWWAFGRSPGGPGLAAAAAEEGEAPARDPEGDAALERLAERTGLWNCQGGLLDDLAITWAVEGESLRLRWTDPRTGAVRGEDLVAWSPALGRLSTTGFRLDDAGRATLAGTLWFEGATLCREHVLTGADGTATTWRERWTPGDDAGAQTVRVDRLDETGDWIRSAVLAMRRTRSPAR